MSESSGPQAVLFDMGGVLLAMGNPVGMPHGKLDFRGREALAHAIRAAGGRIAIDALESVLFEPWRREYARRYELGREADWSPHLKALRHAAHVRSRDLTLLRAWFRPYAETLAPVEGALEAVRTLAAEGPPEEEVGLSPYATPGFDPGPAVPDGPTLLPMPSFPGAR